MLPPDDNRLSTKTISDLLKLRAVVAYLGEKDQSGWWSTRFLGASGKRFLDFSYPRSAFAAGVNAASEAAKAFHDRRIGKGGVFHLFRLPFIVERRTRALLLSGKDRSLPVIVMNMEAAMLAISDLSKDSGTAPDGPVRIANHKALLSGGAIPKLAAFYVDAFRSGKQTLPYFTAEEG